MPSLQEALSLPPILEKKIKECENDFKDLKSWELAQKNAFVGLVNSLLSERAIKITDISRDLRTGYILFNLLEVLSDIDSKLPHKTCKSLYECHDNMTKVFEHLRSKNHPLPINESDIVEGTKINVVLGILWHLILFYHLGKLQRSTDSSSPTEEFTESSALKNLLKWVNQKLAGKMKVRNLEKDFKDGKAYCYLMEALDPSKADSSILISTNEDPKQNSIETLSNAFKNADEKFKIASFLEPEQFYEEPNKEANVAYLSLFQAFEKYNSKRNTEILDLETQLKLANAKISELKHLNDSLTKSNSEASLALENCLSSKQAALNQILDLKQNSDVSEKLKTQNENFLEEIKKLKLANEKLNLENSNLKLGKSKLLSDNKNTKNALKDLESKLSSVTEQLSELQEKESNEKKSGIADFENYLSQLEKELHIPTLSDFTNVNLKLLSENSSEPKVDQEKWPCSNCSFRNTSKDVLCRNCFFVNGKHNRNNSNKIRESDFAKHTITLTNPISHQTTYIYYVGNNKHILKIEHDPNSEKKRIILDGNVLKIKHKKGFWNSTTFNHEFHSSNLMCSLVIFKNKTRYNETKYSYELHIDGKRFDEYKDEYFKKHGEKEEGSVVNK